jgi:hypothetical protein
MFGVCCSDSQQACRLGRVGSVQYSLNDSIIHSMLAEKYSALDL